MSSAAPQELYQASENNPDVIKVRITIRGRDFKVKTEFLFQFMVVEIQQGPS